MASEADASEPFFSTIPENLTQGDIVRGVPWGVLDHPLTLCRQKQKPEGDTLGVGSFTAIERVKGPAAWGKQSIEIIHASARQPELSMVIWEDCQIDKMMEQGQPAHKWYVAVAPVLNLLKLKEADQETIRAGRRMAFFPIPSYPVFGLPESYVDLRLMWPVKQDALGERVIGLSPAAKGLLFSHLFTFLTARTVAENLACQKCGEAIDPARLFVDARE